MLENIDQGYELHGVMATREANLVYLIADTVAQLRVDPEKRKSYFGKIGKPQWGLLREAFS